VFPQSGDNTRGLTASGVVREEGTLEPLPMAHLTLQPTSGSDTRYTFSGTDGDYMFTGLESEDYYIDVDLKGYQPARIEVSVFGKPLMNANIYLKKLAPQNTTGPADPISAHQLSVPDKARDAFDKGVKLITSAKPNYERGVVQFQRAIEEYSTYYEAYAEMAIAYQHLGQSPAAEQALRKAIDLSSSQYADALFLLAEMLDDMNRFGEAEPVARQGIKIEENSWRGHLSLARALAGLKRTREAEASAIQASQLNPNSEEIFLVLGNIHIQEHNYQNVIKDFDAYLRLEPAGPLSDMVRQTEEQARKALRKAQADVAQPAPKP
jgi:tetratricopeptide (TPR) repeat protein